LLSIDIADTEHLYFELGDGSTYSYVQSFRSLIERIAKQHSGALIKVLGTEVQFAFETPLDALRAVVDFAAALEADAELDLQFCAAVHRGTALATSTDGRLDYFGGTVHVVQRMLRLAGGGELMMTETVASDPLVVDEIRDKQLRSQVCDLPQFGPFGSRCQRLHIG
jgi:class 3 adenylate cyclase